MEIKEILEKVKPLVDKIEKEHKIEIIIKQYVEVGDIEEYLKNQDGEVKIIETTSISKRWGKKATENLKGMFAPIFTVGWKKTIKDEQYGNFIVSHQVSSDCENACKITFGDDKIDNKIVEEMTLLCEKDFVEFYFNYKNGDYYEKRELDEATKPFRICDERRKELKSKKGSVRFKRLKK